MPYTCHMKTFTNLPEIPDGTLLLGDVQLVNTGTITNHGTIGAVGDGKFQVVLTTGTATAGTLVNAGTIEAQGNRTSVVISAQNGRQGGYTGYVTNTGVISAQGGSITLDGIVHQDGVASAVGGTFIIAGQVSDGKFSLIDSTMEFLHAGARGVTPLKSFKSVVDIVDRYSSVKLDGVIVRRDVAVYDPVADVTKLSLWDGRNNFLGNLTFSGHYSQMAVSHTLTDTYINRGIVGQ